MLISAAGLVLNIISASILSLKKFQEKFNKYCQIFAINSALFNFNDFLMHLTIILFDQYNMSYSYSKAIYSIVYYIFWSILFTIGGFLDIFITYERIQLINPNIKFLLKKSATRISIGVVCFCLVVNIPLNMSRRFESMQFLVTLFY